MNKETRDSGSGGDGFVRTYHSFLRLKELKQSDKMVFLGLWSFANDTGTCWPSHRKLARASAVSERQVRKSLNNLRDAGLVMTERRSAGRLSSLLYHLAPLDKTALIVAGKVRLEQEKTRWLETLGKTTTEGKPSAGDCDARVPSVLSDLQKLPPPPENINRREGVRKILPLIAPCIESIPGDFDRKVQKKSPEEAKEGPRGGEKRYFLPVGPAVSAGNAAISAYRTRTIELKPEKKNQVLRPWERYLKPQPSRGEAAETLSP